MKSNYSSSQRLESIESLVSTRGLFYRKIGSFWLMRSVLGVKNPTVSDFSIVGNDKAAGANLNFFPLQVRPCQISKIEYLISLKKFFPPPVRSMIEDNCFLLVVLTAFYQLFSLIRTILVFFFETNSALVKSLDCKLPSEFSVASSLSVVKKNSKFHL